MPDEISAPAAVPAQTRGAGEQAHNVTFEGNSRLVHYNIHCVEELVYMEPPRTAIFFFTILLLAFNAWVYYQKKVQAFL
jgi:hypothetical protein